MTLKQFTSSEIMLRFLTVSPREGGIWGSEATLRGYTS